MLRYHEIAEADQAHRITGVGVWTSPGGTAEGRRKRRWYQHSVGDAT